MNGNSGGVDLYREFIDVFGREEMLAFFDFEADTVKGTTLSGLCKVSRPKPGKSESRYLSLLFIIETPDEESGREACARFDAINWELLGNRIPEFESALAIPFTLREFTGNHFREVDIYLKDDTAVSRPFIRGTLCPAVCSVAGIRGGEPLFREELPAAGKSATGILEDGNGDSLVARLRNLFSL